MAAVGTVKAISGVVKAITPDGEERILKLGDTVNEWEEIVTLDDGIIMLQLSNRLLVDLGRNDTITLDPQAIADASPVGLQQTTTEDIEAVTEAAEDEVAALQEALLSGEEPIELEATAAGGPPGAGPGQDDGSTAVIIDYLKPEVTPEAGFDTTGPGSDQTPPPPDADELPGEAPPPPVEPPPPVDLGEPAAEDEGPTGNPEVDNEQFVTFDAEAVNEGGTSISGNILANDSFGPDGKHPDEPVPTIVYNGGLGAATGSQVGNDAVFEAVDGTWTIVVSFIDGSYVFTQHKAYSHDPDADFDDGTFTYTLQDADGDTASGTLTVRIIDDEPSGIFPSTIYEENIGEVSATADLNFLAGADAAGSVVFTETVSSFDEQSNSWTLVLAKDGDGHNLTLNDEQLYLFYADGNDTTTLEGRTVNDGVPDFGKLETLGFQIELNVDTGELTFVADGLSNNTKVEATDLTSVGGGNVAAKALNIGKPNKPDLDTTNDILATTRGATTIDGDDDAKINTSAFNIGIGTAKSFDYHEVIPNDGIRFDFVNNLTKLANPTEAEPSGFTIDGHNLTDSFRQNVSFVTGPPKGDPGQSIKFSLMLIIADDDGLYYGDSIGVDSEKFVLLDRTNIRIFNAGGTDVTNAVIIVNGIEVPLVTITETVTEDSLSISVNGSIGKDWMYEVTTSEEFSAIQLDAVDGTDTFTLGTFSYGSDTPGEPISLQYDIQGADTDGDTIDGNLSVNLFPPETTVKGTPDGSDTADDLDGDENANLILGMDGNDTLDGDAGNDVLVGGPGNDTMTGGAGDDVFDFNVIDAGAIDTITDFNQNGNDVMDLRDIIDLSDGRTIEQWVSLETGTSSTTIKIHANASDDSEVTQTIVLTGYATVAGDDINTLISNNVVMTPDDSMA